MSNCLCLYYTRTQTTKIVMEQIAADLGAELVEYTDGKDRSGRKGYLSCCRDTYRKEPPEVLPFETEKPLSEYETVIIGLPIWAEKCCCVTRGLLKQHGHEFQGDVYFVVTHASKKVYENAISELDEYLNEPQEGHLSVSTKAGNLAGAVRRFEEEALGLKIEAE